MTIFHLNLNDNKKIIAIIIIRRNHVECCDYSPTPDDGMFRQLALVYAQNHPEMKTGHNCDEDFPNGITNGAHWYEVSSFIDSSCHSHHVDYNGN